MFDFSRFLDVANVLSQVNDEAYIRSAISRYYYAIFCCIRRYLIEIKGEFEFEDGFKVHSRISKRLISSDDDTERCLGEALSDLREIRNRADYDWRNGDLSFFKENLSDVKKESELALTQIESLKNFPPYKI